MLKTLWNCNFNCFNFKNLFNLEAQMKNFLRMT